LGIEITGATMAIVLADVTILIVIKRSASNRRTVHLPVRATVVAASNTGQADWLVPIATVVPS
jgi:hypothetical protein